MTTEERKSPFRAMLKAFDPKQAAAENRERTRLYEAFGVKPPFPAKSWVISRMINHYGQEYRDAEKRLLRLGKPWAEHQRPEARSLIGAAKTVDRALAGRTRRSTVP